MIRRDLAAIAVIAAVFVLICAFIARRQLLALWYMVRRVPFRQAECSRIVALITAGRLVPDPDGLVVLPTDLSSATINGCVYVTRKSEGRLYVLFPMRRDKGRDLEGYLYSSQQLTSRDVETGPGGADPRSITVTGPIAAGFIHRRTVPIDYTVTREVGSHWFAVYYNMD